MGVADTEAAARALRRDRPGDLEGRGAGIFARQSRAVKPSRIGRTGVPAGDVPGSEDNYSSARHIVQVDQADGVRGGIHWREVIGQGHILEV